jgi:selenocysteine lyase/cysteine desulfurase
MSRSKGGTFPPIDEAERPEIAPGRNGPDWLPKRREFFRILGAGAGLALLRPATASTAVNVDDTTERLRSRLLNDKVFWTEIEGMFTLNPARIFMNVGTGGSMPREVLEAFDAENRALARDPRSQYSDFLEQRKKIAPGFGVDTDELVMSYNTTAGLCSAILGIPWSKGDVIVTTNHEHRGGNSPLAIAAHRYDVEISRVALPVGNNQNASDYFALFNDHIRRLKARGKRVRAMMWSSPTFTTGTMLPIEQLMDVAKAHGLISIVDGAHLPGMMAYDYANLGMDFMSGSGHKWQCGPGSSGIFVVRNKVRPSNPNPPSEFWPILSDRFPPSKPSGSQWNQRAIGPMATYDVASVLQPVGGMNVPQFKALAKSCEIWDRIGRKKIEVYVVTLGLYLKEKIAERWGADRLYSPKDDPKLLTALTSFNPFVDARDITDPVKSDQFVNRMLSDYSPGFVVKNVATPVIGSASDHRVVRISTHLWNDATDIDRLVDAMWNLSTKMT